VSPPGTWIDTGLKPRGVSMVALLILPEALLVIDVCFVCCVFRLVVGGEEVPFYCGW